MAKIQKKTKKATLWSFFFKTRVFGVSFSYFCHAKQSFHHDLKT